LWYAYLREGTKNSENMLLPEAQIQMFYTSGGDVKYNTLATHR